MEEIHESQSKKKSEVPRRYFAGAIVAVVAIAAFSIGVAVGDMKTDASSASGPIGSFVTGQTERPDSVSKNIEFDRFWDIWEIVRSRYVEQPVDETKLFYGAISGMVASLDDPYSVFLDPDFAAMFESELSGTFQGIGAEIGIKQDQLKIIAPLPDTPAEKAGLMAGDAILAIDDVDTYGMSTDEAVKRIRGPKGETVKLLISRDGAEPHDVSIIRDTIVVVSTRWHMEQHDGLNLGIIEIFHFNESTMPAFEEAVQSILLENPDGLVLDLRNNPGGFLDTAIDVSGEWVLHDIVVQEKFSDGSVRNYLSDGNARLADMPTVVLVNGGSASASEIVAGALQHHGKATIIGEQTFGKGSVQDYVEFDDGSALKMTIALWLTPGGVSIEKEGVTPDEIVELTVEDFNSDLDPQMDRAVERLRSQRNTR
ncbi:MAG: S41 family peptidase [Patescibacteria group bacterium]